MQWMPTRSRRHASRLFRLIGGLLLVLAGIPTAASRAQTPAQGTATVSVERANFRAACSSSADVMATLLEGAEVEVLESLGDWYRVRHTATGVEGCLHRSVLGRVTPPAEVEPEDELREATEREAAQREAAEREAAQREAERAAREAEAEQRARETERTAPRADSGERLTGYLDFNFGFTTPEDDSLSYSSPATEGRPPRPVPGSRAESQYQYARGRTFGVAAGFLRTLASGGRVGAGASLTRATYSTDLDLQVSRPHRLLPPAIVADGIATPGPDREETVLHLHAVFVTPSAERWQMRLFLGPSVFRSELPVWSVAVARFPVNPPRMVIRRVEFSAHEETVVGGHVGADLAYFLSDTFGIGASAVFSRATGELSIRTLDPEEPLVRDVPLGGLAAMLGIRLRL